MLAAQVLSAAQSAGVMIATAESCTGGMVISALTDIAGSSSVVDRGFVTYSNDAKIAMLGVSAEVLAAHGAVSEQVALDMVKGALAHSKAELAVAVTGIAGPGGSEHKPEGRVCFACGFETEIRVETVEFGALGRANVRSASRDHALKLLMTALRRHASSGQV